MEKVKNNFNVKIGNYETDLEFHTLVPTVVIVGLIIWVNYNVKTSVLTSCLTE